MSDAELVRLAIDGQRSAYEQLVRRWGRRIVAVCRARIGVGAAEDLAQETLLRGWQHLNELEQPEKFGAWLRGIAVRVCLDWLKSAAARSRTSQSGLLVPIEQAIAEVESPDHDAARIDEQKRILSEIDNLPEELREVILLYYYDDVTYQELADLLGVARATINARLAKARSMLARRLSSLVR